MDVVKIEKLQYLQIGVQGETGALSIPIDVTSWEEELRETFPQMGYHILFKPNGATSPIIVLEKFDGPTNTLTWEITLPATYAAGMGYTEIRLLDHQNGLLKKSRVIPTTVETSVSGVEGGTVPAPYEDWVNQVLATKDELNNIFESATTTFQKSDNGTTVPSGSWSETPVIEKGKYLWCRTAFNWGIGSVSYMYSVSYIGDDTTGAVTAINGATGNVVLDAGDINVDKTAVTPVTVATKLGQKLDASMIVYDTSDDGPDSPVEGMIWLKPKG